MYIYMYLSLKMSLNEDFLMCFVLDLKFKAHLMIFVFFEILYFYEKIFKLYM